MFWKRLKLLDKTITVLGLIFAIVMLVVAIYTGYHTSIKQGEDIGVVVGVNLALVGVLFGFFTIIFWVIREGLISIDERVDLHVKHDTAIGDLLTKIISLLTGVADSKRKEVKKRFNGIRHYLEQEGLERNLSDQILKEITKTGNFSAVSSFPLEWWFQPEGIFYLTKQLIEISKSSGAIIKRFVIYKHEIYKEYGYELLDLIDSHRRAVSSEESFNMLLYDELITDFPRI